MIKCYQCDEEIENAYLSLGIYDLKLEEYFCSIECLKDYTTNGKSQPSPTKDICKTCGGIVFGSIGHIACR